MTNMVMSAPTIQSNIIACKMSERLLGMLDTMFVVGYQNSLETPGMLVLVFVLSIIVTQAV